MRITSVLKLVSALVLWSAFVHADENYCLDEETNAQWESIAERNKHDLEIIKLYRLRKALCVQVEKGFISVPEATEIFEVERERVIKSLPTPRA